MHCAAALSGIATVVQRVDTLPHYQIMTVSSAFVLEVGTAVNRFANDKRTSDDLRVSKEGDSEMKALGVISSC